MTEYQLITGLKQGVPNAIKELLGTYTEQLCFFSARLVGNREEARDIVTDCFLSFLHRLNDGSIVVNDITDLRKTLFTMVRYRSINSQIAQVRYEARIREYAARSEKEVVEYSDGEFYIIKKLSREIEALPDRQKEILKMRYFEELSPAEIARQLQLSDSTVRNQLHNALRTLRLSFKDDEWTKVLILFFLSSFGAN